MFKDVLHFFLGHTPEGKVELNYSKREELQLLIIAFLFTVITGLFGMFFLSICGGVATFIALIRVVFFSPKFKR